MSGAHSNLGNSAQYIVVHDFVSGHATSLSDAQDSFTKPVEDTYLDTQNAEQVESALWRSWGAIIQVAKSSAQDTSKCEKLVDFVLALSQRPDLKKNGNVCKVWDLPVWSELPIFGAAMRDNWNTPSESASEHEHQAWLNLTAFTATLVANAHKSHADKPDFTLYAIWALREAFEEPKPSTIAIKAAATWLMYASSTLVDLSKSAKSFDGKLARPGSAFADKQWKGYSEDRLQTWLFQLRGVETASLGKKGEELVRKAKGNTQGIAM